MKHHPRAFTMIETLASLLLIAGLGVLTTRLFVTLSRIMYEAPAAEEAIHSFESAASALRHDAWSAGRFRALDDRTVELTSGASPIRWSIDPSGDLVRLSDDTRRWPRAASDATLVISGPSLVLRSKEGGEIRFISQMQLTEAAQP